VGTENRLVDATCRNKIIYRGHVTKAPTRAPPQLIVLMLVLVGAVAQSSTPLLAQNSTNSANGLLSNLSPLLTAANSLNQGQESQLQLQTNSLAQTYAFINNITSLINSLTPATLGAVMSCPVFADQGTLLGEGSCAWANSTGRRIDQSDADGASGYITDYVTYSLGGQKEIAPSWFVGSSLSMGTTWTRNDSGGTGHGQIFGGGVTLKHTIGPWLFAGAIALGTTSNYSNNSVSGLPGVSSLQSDTNAFFTGARLRAAYDFAFGAWYVRPRADLDIIYTHVPAFQVSGQSGSVVSVPGLDKVSPILSPMVEFGGRYDLDQQTILRPYLAVGMSIYPSNTTIATASVIINGATTVAFQNSLKAPSVVGNADFGVQLYQVGGFEVKAEYDVSAADAYLSQSISLRGAYHF